MNTITQASEKNKTNEKIFQDDMFSESCESSILGIPHVTRGHDPVLEDKNTFQKHMADNPDKVAAFNSWITKEENKEKNFFGLTAGLEDYFEQFKTAYKDKKNFKGNFSDLWPQNIFEARKEWIAFQKKKSQEQVKYFFELKQEKEKKLNEEVEVLIKKTNIAKFKASRKREAEGRASRPLGRDSSHSEKLLRPASLAGFSESEFISFEEGRRLAEGQFSEAEGRTGESEAEGRSVVLVPDLKEKDFSLSQSSEAEGRRRMPKAFGRVLGLGSGGLPPALSELEHLHQRSVSKRMRIIAELEISYRRNLATRRSAIWYSKAVEMCQNGTHVIASWSKKNPDKIRFRPFKCGSVRCSHCAPKVQMRNFARIRQGLENNPGRYLFMVLTFDRHTMLNMDKAYVLISDCWEKLKRKIDKQFGKIMGVQTVEQHKDGWPHLNVLFKFKNNKETFKSKRTVHNFVHGWLRQNAQACGFGPQASCEYARGADIVAKYIVKCGTEVVGEVTKQKQIPKKARLGTRFLRSFGGFLPPRIKNENYTGCIVKGKIEDIQKMEVKNIVENFCGSEKMVTGETGYNNFEVHMEKKYPELVSVTSVEFVVPDITNVAQLPRKQKKIVEEIMILKKELDEIRKKTDTGRVDIDQKLRMAVSS